MSIKPTVEPDLYFMAMQLALHLGKLWAAHVRVRPDVPESGGTSEDYGTAIFAMHGEVLLIYPTGRQKVAVAAINPRLEPFVVRHLVHAKGGGQALFRDLQSAWYDLKPFFWSQLLPTELRWDRE